MTRSARALVSGVPAIVVRVEGVSRVSVGEPLPTRDLPIRLPSAPGAT